MLTRQALHQVFRAECGRCGFAVHGEIRNGCGGWRSFSWDEFSRHCSFRTPAGKATFVCPHLRAAKINSRPTVCSADAEPARAAG